MVFMENVIDIRKEFDSYWNQMEAIHGCEMINVVIGRLAARVE